MPFYKLDDIHAEFVTPKHSTAFGRLVTGEQIELGVLQYKAGEGANEHAHPQEQIFLVLKGRMRMTIDRQSSDLGPGDVARMPPNVPHSVVAIEDSEVISTKTIVGGAGHRI